MKRSKNLRTRFSNWMKKPMAWFLALFLVFGVFVTTALAEPPDPDEFRIEGELLQPGPTTYPLTNELGETLEVTLEVKNDGEGQYVPPGSYNFSSAEFKGGGEGFNTYYGTYNSGTGLWDYFEQMMCALNGGGNVPDISHIDFRCTPTPPVTTPPVTTPPVTTPPVTTPPVTTPPVTTPPVTTPPVTTPPVTTPPVTTPPVTTPPVTTPPVTTPTPATGLCLHIGYSITIDGVRYDDLFDYRKMIEVGDIIISADGEQEYVLFNKAIKPGDIINSIPDINKLLGLPEGTLVLDEKNCQHFPLTVSVDNEQNYIDLQFTNPTGAEFTTTPQLNIPEICVLYATIPCNENGKILIDDIEETYSTPGYKMKSLKVFEGFTYPENFPGRIVMVNSELNLVFVTKTK